MKADRRVYAVSYPATVNANTLTVHTITPAIVIRTVCCHMVSIPHFGLMLSGTLDQRKRTRSDGRHRRYFPRQGAKNKIPRTGGARGSGRGGGLGHCSSSSMVVVEGMNGAARVCDCSRAYLSSTFIASMHRMKNTPSRRLMYSPTARRA